MRGIARFWIALAAVLACMISFSIQAQGLDAEFLTVRELLKTPEVEIDQVLASTNLSRPETVYLNWYRFDNIDSLKTVDFESHFPDIWYPSADDLDVFDDSLRWVLTITHNGLMRLTVF